MPVKAISELPLLRFRNVPSNLTLARKQSFVRDDGLPAIENPQNFVQTMARWEQTLGTTYASLGGMVMMSGSPSVDQVIEGFEVFHGICQRLSPFLTGTTLEHAQALFEEIKTRLIFEPDMPSMLEGLQNFDYNLNSQYYLTVGDCVVCTAIFGLLFSHAGGLVGEAHAINSLHTTTFLEPYEYCYESAKSTVLGNEVSLRPMTQNKPLVISGILSFFSTMTVMATLKVFSDTFMIGTLPKTKLEEMLQYLACAEAVNPYHLEIYKKRADLLCALGRWREAKFDHIYEALGSFGQRTVKVGML